MFANVWKFSNNVSISFSGSFKNLMKFLIMPATLYRVKG